MKEARKQSANRFAILQDDHEDNVTASTSKSADTANNSPMPKIPPIIVLKKTAEFARNMVKEFNYTDCSIKLTSVGVKIFPSSEEQFAKIKEYLAKADCEYYSHQNSKARPLKIVLSGLHEMPTIELYEELTRIGIQCEDVKQMKIKNKKYNEQSNYLIYFKKGSIKINELRMTKSIFNTIIKWDFYKKSSGTFTQCRKCQMYGHGQESCNVKPNCAFCSGNHSTSECNTTTVIKCCNCGGEHKSFSPDCPKRAEYIALKEKLRAKASNSRSKYTSQPVTNKVPIINSKNFPPLPTSRNMPPNQLNSSPQQSWDRSGQMPPSQNINTANLFTADELIKITTELMINLKLCKSKEEQFQVITKLAIKYVYEK